jgi:hypothetical protein
MKRAILLVTLAIALVSSSPALAQSTVTDIYKAMADNAARAAQARADAYASMVREAAAAAAEMAERRAAARVVYVPAPVSVVAPAPVAAPDWFALHAPPAARTASEAQQTYLEEALAYAKELDNEKTAAALVAQAGEVAAPMADCGIKPIRPVPPIGCRDLVAQCVLDGQGHPFWQWVCVNR